jgi:hypothetical protein
MFVFSFPIYAAKEATMLTDISSLKWKNRIILVNTISSKNSILKVFEQNKAEINERDIVWFVIKDKSVDSNFNGNLSNNFLFNLNTKFKGKPLKVVLLGKDGGVKSVNENLDLKAIFLQIDGMPMRQFEINN